MYKHKKIYIIIAIILVAIAFVVTLSVLSLVDRNTEANGTCPSGFIAVPGNDQYSTKDFCVMKYEAKNVNGAAKSQYELEPWTSITQTEASTVANKLCDGCHLITEDEWLTIAQNVLSVPENWALNTVGGDYIYSGHNDNNPSKALAASNDDEEGYINTGNIVAQSEVKNGTIGKSQRRTLKLTNGQTIWDLAGNVAEWTSGQTTGSQPGTIGESDYVWKDWNAVNFNGSLFPNPFPGYGDPLTGAWASDQGIGQLYSYMGESNNRAFIRGGSYSQNNYAGIFSLYLGNEPNYKDASIGFRVVK
ncbi:MAG: hypothetical protein PWQ10_97 [Patescibacteria group bacterium]|nr:hypothetical protein [Patescibacteria group bacterium]